MADCALFILWDDERKLALMEDRPDLNPGSEHYWVFPGGKVEPGETGFAAAERECREETGIEALSLIQLSRPFRSRGVPGTKSARPDGWRVEAFVVERWRGGVPARSLDHQRAPLDWRDPRSVEPSAYTCNYDVATHLTLVFMSPGPAVDRAAGAGRSGSC